MLNFDVTAIIGLLAIGQLSALMLYLASQLRTLPVLVLPVLLLCTLAIALSHDILLHSKLALLFPQVLGLGPLHTYLIGPLVLLLGYKLLKPAQPLSKFNLIHFGPFLVLLWAQLPTLLLSSEAKLQFIQHFYANPSPISSAEFSVQNIFQI